MSRAFGMLVEDVVPLPRRASALVLSGPTVGIAPDPRQRLVFRGALGSPEVGRYVGPEMIHRVPAVGPAGVVVSGLERIPACYRGAVVHEEGVWCRTFGALLHTGASHLVAAARFDLNDGRAFGLLKIEHRVVAATVIGGGLPMDANLWNELKRIVTSEGKTFAAADFKPLGLGWPVSAWTVYPREGGARTVLITHPCGPAEPGMPVLVYDDRPHEAEVLAQQHQGLVQVDVESPVNDRPAFVVASAM